MKIDNLAMQEIRHTREMANSEAESCRSRSGSPVDLMSPDAVPGLESRGITTSARDNDPAPTECHGQPDSMARDATREKSLEPLVVQSDSVDDEDDSQVSNTSFTSTLSLHHSVTRREAYDRMLQNYHGTAWNSIELISTGCNHSVAETEL